MAQKYSELKLTHGIRHFYDVFKQFVDTGNDIINGFKIRTDEWYDPDKKDYRIQYLVFTGTYENIEFDVHFAFKNDFKEGFVGNICPKNATCLSPNKYNICMDVFVNAVMKWYGEHSSRGNIDFAYDRVPLDLTQNTSPGKLREVSKVPAGEITFSFGGTDTGVGVYMSAVVNVDICVEGLIEHYAPKDSDSIFRTAKVYELAEFTLDIGKMDAFRVSGSDKTPLELLKENDIVGFTFNGSTYVATSKRVTGCCTAKILADRLVLTLR